MKEPNINKYPTEIFGYPFTEHSEAAKAALKAQFCPFLKGECKKPRKSEPHIKIGVCSAGYKGGFLPTAVPVILCPHRFETDSIFKTLQAQYFPAWKNVQWAKEVSIGVGGNVDFVATECAEQAIQDFLCIEFQAAGTTGTPWQAILDFKQNRTFTTDNYPYGINWANEFVKTMMQQVYKKGKIIAHWKRKIVFVFQDVGLSYIRSACDTSGLRAAHDEDPIHFCTFKMVWKDTKWDLVFAEKLSTDVEGINKILGGALTEDYPSVATFMNNISRKLEF
jgi:Restriction endonuclease NotI